MMNRRRFAIPAFIGMPAPLYVLRLDHVAGMMGDDAWYILLAKSLADGHGYWLTNAPLAGILPQSPPGFPALLSLVFQLHPQFPGNVWLLKSVSIAAMLGVAALTYFYLHAHRQLPRHLAALASVAAATTPALVFLATSTVMSECVFTLTQLATLVVARRTVEAPSEHRSRDVVFAGLLGAATVFLRSAGIAVVAAVFFTMLKERLPRRAALFAVVILACWAPWLLYARAHAPTPAQQEVHRRIDRVRIRRTVLDALGRIAFDGTSVAGRFACAGRPKRRRPVRPRDRWRLRARARARTRRKR